MKLTLKKGISVRDMTFDKPNKAAKPPVSVAAIPSDFDWRVESPKCKDQINAQYNQGQCGSCYAFSATGALADRNCIALASKDASWQGGVKKYSQQDVLSCGTRKQGNMCINTANNGPTTKYANNCDGGFARKVMEYAVDQGLVKESCDPYAVSGDFDGPAGGETTCQLRNTGKGIRSGRHG